MQQPYPNFQQYGQPPYNYPTTPYAGGNHGPLPPPQANYNSVYNTYSGYPQTTPYHQSMPLVEQSGQQPDLLTRYQSHLRPESSQPLKSAMRKTPAVNTHTLPPDDSAALRRRKRAKAQQESSDQHDPLMGPSARPNPQKQSIPFQTIHMFMSFKGSGELIMEHLTEHAKLEIRQSIVKAWPAGVEFDEQHGYTWRVKFRGSPWDMNGSHVQSAFYMLTSMLELFAQRGFTLQTTALDSRYVFVTTPPDRLSSFFLCYFANSARRFVLINPPTRVADTIAEALKNLLPEECFIVLPRTSDGALIIDLTGLNVPTNLIGVPVVDASIFQLFVLHVLSHMGFQLETSIRMAPKMKIGPFSIGHRQEILVFKGYYKA